MGIFDIVGSVVGGTMDIVGTVLGGGGGTMTPTGGSNDGMIAMANASRDAAIAQSNAQVQIAQAQAATMQLGILKSSQAAQFQTLAWLTDRLDTNDTKLQIAVENAKLQMQAQSDHHVEAMEGLKNDVRELEIREYERVRSGGVPVDTFMA
jgi:hypothetical protein